MGLSDWVPDSSDEADTDRDGFLSTRREIHAFTHGLYAGMKDWKPSPGGLPDNDDVQAEPHYYKGGFVVGTVLQFIGVGVFVLATFGVV